MPSHPIIVAHRGLHSVEPENSEPAFQRAKEAGLTWVECDVWESRDGQAVVIHDESLDRTTTGTGTVASHDWAFLQQLHLVGSNREANHCRLPRLADLIRLDLSWMVEIKPVNSPRLVRQVIDLFHQRPGQWLMQSFDSANLLYARAYDPLVSLALLVEDMAELIAARSTDIPAIHMKSSLLTAEVACVLRSQGRRIGVWTVNTQQEMRRVIDLGADVLITDDPEAASQIATEARAMD